jgi:hypothetical protein
MNCHYYRALLDAAALAGLEGDGARRSDWLSKAETVKDAINERLWNDGKSVYAHSRIGDGLTDRLAVHDSVMAAYADVATPERMKWSLDALFGASPADAVTIGSPYFYFFYLGALRHAGMHQEALDATREAYGGMLDAGATSWWEHFHGRESLSHAWSCAPTYDLSTYVLGVKPTEPGFASFSVEPHPADLKWARGVVPTPRGDIQVEWRRDYEEFELRVGFPFEAHAELTVPARSLKSTELAAGRIALGSHFGNGRAGYRVFGSGTFIVRSEL